MIKVETLRTPRTHIYIFRSVSTDYSYFLVCGRWATRSGETLFHAAAVTPLNEDDFVKWGKDPWGWEGSNTQDALKNVERYINNGTFAQEEVIG